jgi:hypothetical protein
VIVATRIARRRAVRSPAGRRSAPRANAIGAVLKVVSIIAITSAHTAPA